MQMDPISMVGQLLDNGSLRVTQVIGSGSFATVYLAVSTSPPIRHYAVKSLFKPGLSASQLALQQHELNFLQLVSPHPNIVTLHSALQDENFLHLVMEFAPNDLFDFIADMETMDDAVIKDTFSQIVKAVKHCHKLNVYHRDLKPENILIVPVSTTAFSPKITDFGLATREISSKDFGCGSIRYLAPECLPNSSAKSYSPAKADIWALGIILVNLISGKNPWRRADDSDECFNCYKTDTLFWKAFGVSKSAQSLVSDILHVDPRRRIGLDEIERRLSEITVFRDLSGMQDIGEDRESTIGTVVMEREHRSWNSWNSEMSFARPPVFGDAVVPEEMQIKSPVLSRETTFEDDYEDEDDGIIFPPMDDDHEELFAKVLVHGQVPSFVKTGQQKTEKSKKKRGKSKKRKPKTEIDAIEKEPHENSDTSPTLTNSVRIEVFKNSDSASTPIAIPRNRNMFEGDKTPTGRNEVSTMTEDDDESPRRWQKFLAPPGFDKILHSPASSSGRSGSRTPPGKAINPSNSPSNPFMTRESDHTNSLGQKIFEGSSNHKSQLTPTAPRPMRGVSPDSNKFAVPLNRSAMLTPTPSGLTRAPSGGTHFTGRNSPPTIFSPDRTPRKQEYHPSTGDRTPPGRNEFFGNSGYHNLISPATRSSGQIRRSESGIRPILSNRPSTTHYNPRASFSGNRQPNYLKPPTTGNRHDVKHYVNFHALPTSNSRGHYDDQKWTKSTNAFGKHFGSRNHNDEWKKLDEWQPFGGLMEFGWDKHGKRETGRRDGKKREII